MSILELDKGEIPENIIKIKNLIVIGELDKALQLMKNCKEKDKKIKNNILFRLIECDILYQQGLYENLYAFAGKIYKERLKLGDKLITADMLNLMADCSICSNKYEKVPDLIKHSERILKILTQNSSKGILQREAYLTYVKGRFFIAKNDSEKAIKYLEHSLALGENLSNKLLTILSLMRISYIDDIYKGELGQAFKYAENGLILAKKSNHKFAIAYSYAVMAGIYSNKGKIDKSISLYNRSLTIFKKLDSAYLIAVVNNNLGESYRTKGNLKLALRCLEKSLILNHDLGLFKKYGYNHDYLIQILVDIGDFQRAKQYLHELKVLNNQLNDEILNHCYLFDKALILKGNTSHTKQVQAKEIFKRLIRKYKIPYEILIKCLLYLCELLLDELRDTNNVELLNEIPSYINQIMDSAKKQKSYLLLAETYLLKANFDSFTLNLDRAKSYLTKAQNVAERYGMTQLIQRVLIEKKKILHQNRDWRKLNDTNKSLMDFTNFTSLKEQIRYMIKKRSILKNLKIER